MRFEEENKPWPFRPDHITCDGDARGLKGTGIITNRHLQGIQSEICHAVGHPTIIFEFADDGTPVRTDSPLLTYAFHPTCGRFRQMNLRVDEDPEPSNGALCAYCDNCYASLLRGLTEDELTVTNVMKRKHEARDLNKLYAGVSDCVIEAKVCNGRPSVQYDCPLLGYRELLFPVTFEGKVISAFFLGQIVLEGQEQFIEKMIESLPRRFPGCFDGYRRKYDKNTQPRAIVQEILQEHRRWLDEKPQHRILSLSEYEEIIRTTSQELKAFEGLLVDEVDHQRLEYIRNNVSSEVEKLTRPSQSSRNREKVDDDTLMDLWNRVEDSMDRLADCFSLRYALVFGIKRIIHAEEDKLEVVAKTRRWNEVFGSEEDLQNLSIDTEGLPDGYLVCSKDKNDQYLECLQGCDLHDLGDFQLFLVPVSAYRYSSIAILVGYGDEHNSTAHENLPGGALDTNLQSFYTLVVSSLAAILARGAEDNAQKQLQYLGHEAGQLVAGLDWLRMTYLTDPHEVKYRLAPKKIEDICQDLEGFIGQLSFIFDMASQMGTGELLEVEMSEFKPFGEVLFKWKDTYRLENERKCLQIQLVAVDSRDMWRPVMCADKFLFEQVVYNLVNNAQKYCYRGTKIDIDCKLRSIDEDQSRHVLTVTNYGRHMSPGDDVYLPFVRRETAGDVEGLGLGLYIAWLIVVKVHGGTIRHDCTKKPVSRFNIPLIKPYIERSFEGKNLDLGSELEAELDQLRATGHYDSIVAFSDNEQTTKYKPSDDVLRNEIRRPTYKVTITATIPAQERRH